MLDKYLDVKKENKAHKYMSRILICIIILLLSLIGTSLSSKVKNFYKEYIFDDSFEFMKFKNFFSKISGTEKEEEKENTSLVMSSFISYESKEKYLNGERYEGVKENFINALVGGIVTFVGDKDEYSKTIIIQGSNGYDIWYFLLDDVDVNIYDYVKADTIIGSINNEFGLLISKDGKYYTYEEYLNAL